HGADLKRSAGELLQFAYRRNDSEMVRLLTEAGIERKNLNLRLSLRSLANRHAGVRKRWPAWRIGHRAVAGERRYDAGPAAQTWQLRPSEPLARRTAAGDRG